MSSIPAAGTFTINVTVQSTFTDAAAFSKFAAQLQALMAGFSVPAAVAVTNLPNVTPAPADPAATVSVTPPAETAPKGKAGRPKKPVEAETTETPATVDAPVAPVEAPAVAAAPVAPVAPVETPAASADAPALTHAEATKRALAHVKAHGADSLAKALKAAGAVRMSDIPPANLAAFLDSLGK